VIDLDDLIVPDAPSKGVEPIDPLELVASANFAPQAWQSRMPDDAWSFKPPVARSEDLTRIVAIPRRPQLEATSMRGAAMVQLITQRFARPNPSCRCRSEYGRDCILSLRLTQAWALYEIGIGSGMLGPIGVGHGKTILDLLTPLALRDCRVAVLLVPPGLVTQLIAEYHLLAEHFRVPSLIVHGKDWSNVVPGAPALHVFPYSRLSRPEATTFLETMAPDAIIADEVHKLRNADTATTSRVMRYFFAHPTTRFCGWSGSITDSSLRDYAHLSALALRERSPLPLDPAVVEDWARAIDPNDYPAPMGALEELCEPGEDVHRGFHRRLVETQGVITTTEPAVDCELFVGEQPPPVIPGVVNDALKVLRADWLRPDGEELIEPLELARCAWQLACGFYYRWTFPLVNGQPQTVGQIEAWKLARKEWRRELRAVLAQRREHLDSPHLCKLAAIRGWEVEGAVPSGKLWYRKSDGLPVWRSERWPAWRAIKDTVVHETEAVRMHPFLAEAAAQWAHANHGIVWYQHGAFGAWVAELSGLPLHAGGPQAGPNIAKEIKRQKLGEIPRRSIIASIKSHGTGRDGLQSIYQTQLIANPPSSATDWEQLLGRLHRIGQKAPRVEAWFYRHTEELSAHVDQALKRALYVQGTLGSKQKLRVGIADL
jgi:hypothetical protein